MMRKGLIVTKHWSAREMAHAIQALVGDLGHAVITPEGDVRGKGLVSSFFAVFDRADGDVTVALQGDSETVARVTRAFETHGEVWLGPDTNFAEVE